MHSVSLQYYVYSLKFLKSFKYLQFIQQLIMQLNLHKWQSLEKRAR